MGGVVHRGGRREADSIRFSCERLHEHLGEALIAADERGGVGRDHRGQFAGRVAVDDLPAESEHHPGPAARQPDVPPIAGPQCAAPRLGGRIAASLEKLRDDGLGEHAAAVAASASVEHLCDREEIGRGHDESRPTVADAFGAGEEARPRADLERVEQPGPQVLEQGDPREPLHQRGEHIAPAGVIGEQSAGAMRRRHPEVGLEPAAGRLVVRRAAVRARHREHVVDARGLDPRMHRPPSRESAARRRRSAGDALLPRAGAPPAR